MVNYDGIDSIITPMPILATIKYVSLLLPFIFLRTLWQQQFMLTTNLIRTLNKKE